MYNLKFLLLAIFLYSSCKANISITSIDSLISVTDDQLYENNVDYITQNAEKILKFSELNNYEKGKLYGNFFLGVTARMHGDNENMVRYTFAAEKLAKEYDDKYVLAFIFLQKATIYKEAGLYNSALNFINQGLTVSNSIQQYEKRNCAKGKLLVYKAICMSYLNPEWKQILRINLEAMKLLEKAGKPFGYDYNYLNVASTYETLGELDKAEFFYRKSLKVSTGNLKGMGYCNLAHLAFLHGRFEDATNYANTSLDYQENNSNKRYRDIAEIYQLLTKIYTETGNTAAAKKSEKLFEYYHNKENYTNELFKKKLLIQLLAKAELNQKDFEMEVSKKSRNLLVFSVISMVLIICLGMIYMKQVKSNRKTIEKNNEQLSELSQQINNSFSEVLELAKSDDPAFIPRFKEVYPVFYQNLLSRYPDLTIAQIRFCCLLRLNFSTKEVAHYHRLTIKGVQTRKTRLRKQLNIPSDADLNLWMMNLG